MKERIKRIEDALADRLASFMATMLLFWILLILDVAGAIVDPPANVQAWLLWGVSILFQSVALPILALVSNKQGDRMEKKIDNTQTAVMAELAESNKRHDENAAQLAELQQLHREKQESDLRRDAMLQRILEAVGGDE